MKYCEKGERGARAQHGLSWNLGQAEYDLKCQPILSVTEKSGSVFIETKQTFDPKCIYRYEVVCIDGEWRLKDKRKCKYNPDQPRWNSTIL
jgi:hypothetical protein